MSHKVTKQTSQLTKVFKKDKAQPNENKDPDTNQPKPPYGERYEEIVDRASKRRETVEAFKHIWDNYVKHAWGKDEIRPVCLLLYC